MHAMQEIGILLQQLLLEYHAHKNVILYQVTFTALDTNNFFCYI